MWLNTRTLLGCPTATSSQERAGAFLTERVPFVGDFVHFTDS